MELQNIAFRVVFTYVVLLALLRFSGRRTIGQASPQQFVLAIVLGDLVDDLLWAEVGAAKFVAAAGALILGTLLVAVATQYSEAFYRLVNGIPVPVMRNGALVSRGMRAERMNERDVESLLRLRGIERDRWTEVEKAWLEEDGALSVLLREADRPAQDRDRADVAKSLGPAARGD
jgi:uncharacterized membrane protein YcaP (DUF421 family)